MQFTENDIIDCVGSTYFKRGRQYWREKRVLFCKVIRDEPDMRIIGAVQGRQRRKYSQEIELIEHAGELWVDTSCSCPMEIDCKHVAAVMLEALAKLGGQAHTETSVSKQKDPLQEWMNSTQREVQPLSLSNRLNDQHDLLYLLQPGNRSISFSLFKARRLIKGGYGKPSRVGLHEFSSYYAPNYTTQDDRQLCLLLNSQTAGRSQFLEDDWGLLALLRMLASGRCFWLDLKSPSLKLGPSKTLQLLWQQDQQLKHLELSLDDCTVWHCVATTPPYYIDTQHHLVGPIETELPGYLLQQLSKLPAVSATQAPALAQFLRRSFPTLELPLPIALKEKRVRTKPKPILQLDQISTREYDAPILRLDYLYDEYRLPPMQENEQSVVLMQNEDTFVLIHRDKSFEGRMIEQLSNLGFLHGDAWDIEDQHPLPMLLSADNETNWIRQWLHFIEQELPQLQAQGWEVEILPEFDLRVSEADIHIDIEDKEHGWFDMMLDVELNGQRMPLLPLLAHWLENYDGADIPDEVLLPSQKGWLRMPGDKLRPIMSSLLELYNPKAKQQDRISLPNSRAAVLHELDNACHWRNASNTKQLAEQLYNFKGIETVKLPQGLQADLRPYQQQGLNWLNFLARHHFGGILADDMGLGKTLQTLSFIMHEKQHDRLMSPVLVIAPTSLLWNWRMEAQKFTPQLKVLVLHGAQRHRLFKRIPEHNLIISSYALLPRDHEYYQKLSFSMLVLDEAQYIKNPKTKAAGIIRQINSPFRLCLSGTPLENHLGELWALMDFALPGLLGSEIFFRQYFRNPIEKQATLERQQELNRRLAPFILRRSKQTVIKELPAKTEIQQAINLEKDQRNLYETIRIAMQKRIRDLVKNKGLARSHIEFLDALLKLRQACCDPRLVKLKSSSKCKHSAKLEWLKQTLPEMIEEGRKILLFSQFTGMLSLIEEEIKKLGIRYTKLTGQTRNREKVIEIFQQGQADLFLISLKAGGTGLNLTAADVVIHYDPWWNPAVEQQATSRAHRIGQDKAIFVYKLIAENTVEEKIQQLQIKKQALASALYDESDQQVWQGGADELLSLLE